MSNEKVRGFINSKKPGLVDNWSHQASLLSYTDVCELMQDYADKENKSLLEQRKALKSVNRKLKAENEELNKQIERLREGIKNARLHIIDDYPTAASGILQKLLNHSEDE